MNPVFQYISQKLCKSRRASVVFLLLGVICSFSSQAQVPFSSLGYAYERTILLDPASGSSDLIDFPVLINIVSDANLAAHVKHPNGWDIIFITNDGYKLDHEIETFEPSTGQLIAWVKIPTLLSTGNTSIRMLYGNPQVTINPSTNAVWNNYAGVWHLGNTNDATSNGNNGSAINGAVTTTLGKIGNSYNFDGSTGYIQVPDAASLDITIQITLSAWINADALGNYKRIIAKSFTSNNSPYTIYGLLLDNAAPQHTRLELAKGGAQNSLDGTSDLTTNQWFYVTATYNGTTLSLYVNGNPAGSNNAINGSFDQNNVPLSIGASGFAAPADFFDGRIDEARVAGINRSSGWILTEYLNQNDPASFYSLLGEQPHSVFTFDNICPHLDITYSVLNLWDSYEWYPVGGTVISGQGTHSVTIEWLTSTGNEKLSLKVGKGAGFNTSIEYSISVFEAPITVISPDPLETCPGNDVSLNGNPSGGSGTFTNHNWSGTGSASLSATNIVNPVFNNSVEDNYSLIYAVTDNRGCVGRDTLIASVSDDEKPIPTCGKSGNQAVNSNNACTYVHPDNTWNGTATDNCSVPGNITITYNLYTATTATGLATLNGQAFNLGTTWVRMIAEDEAGNIDSCSFTVTVSDDDNPTASNPAPINVQCIGDVPAADISVVTDEADNCTVNPVVAWVSDVSDGNTCPEVITRTYSITDDCANSITVTQTITVNDDTDPTASNPAPINVQCIGDVPAADISVVTDEADNCTVNPVVAWVSDVSDGNTCPEVITRTYSITDDCSNSITVTQTITVKDTIAPTFSVPANDTICWDLTCNYNIDPTATGDVINENDNCSTGLEATYVDDLSNLNGCDTAGYIIRTWSLQDKCVNTTSKNQIIWVEPRTTVTTSPDSDTLCSGELTTIKISSISEPTRPVLFRYETRIPYGITVTPGSGNALPNDTIISDVVQNNTDTAKLVLFIVTPYTRRAGSESEKCAGLSDTTKIWVEPIPKVVITPVKDTICTALFPDISSSSVTVSLQPVRLYYELDYNKTEVEIIHAQDTLNLSPGNSTIRDTIINHSSVPQQVIFFVYPYLLGSNGISKCPGIPDTSYVWVAPELRIVVDTISTYIGGRNIRCHEENNGFIKLKPTGGITAFTGYDDGDLDYTWNLNRGHSRDTSSLRAGNYSIVIGDKLMCADDSVFNLTQPDTLVNFIREIDKISCLSNDGKLSADTYGGFPGYSYEWTVVPEGYNEKIPPILEDTLFNTKDGHYRLVVLDTNGCRGVADTVIQQAPAMDVTAMADPVYGKYKIRCHGEFSGELVSISNDTILRPVIEYEWTGPDGFSMTYTNNLQYNYLHNLKAGIYNLNYTNELGCKGFLSMDMNEPDSLQINEPQISRYPGGYNVTCYGSDNGSIRLNPTGGHSLSNTNIYRWEAIEGIIVNDTAKDQENLPAGRYKITVSDSLNFCSTVDTIVLIQPDEIQISSEISSSLSGGFNINCFGDASGFIKLQASGGVPPVYQYQWMDDPAAPKDRYNLKAGEYIIKVTDGLGCNITDTLSLTQPGLLTIDSVFMSDYHGYQVSCNGLSDGMVSVTPSGGVTDYSFEWTLNDVLLAQNMAYLDSVPAGRYKLKITDANNCEIIWSDSLVEPAELNLTIESKNISCTGTVLGRAQALVTGGISPYLYLWSDGETTSGISGLTTGYYEVSITDLNLCQIKDTVTIAQNTEVQVDIQVVNPISCNGLSDGVLQAVAQDGVPPYTYNWGAAGPWDQTNSGLKAGTYSVIVRDNEGCVGNQNLVFNDPDPIELVIEVVNPRCFGNSDGTVLFNASGGTPAYNFFWDNEAVTGNEVGNLKTGKYNLEIRDSKNCETDTLISVSQPDKLVIHLDEQNTVPPFCPDWQNGVLSVKVEGGTRDYTFLWEYNNSSDSVLRDIKEDFYTILVTDAQNCSADTAFKLKALNRNCLGIPTAFTPNADGANDTWEIRYMTENGAEVQFDEVYPEGVIQVYDRIGNLVFRCTGGCPEDWDGNDLTGRELPVDTYYFVIDLNSGKGNDTLKGIVTIIR